MRGMILPAVALVLISAPAAARPVYWWDGDASDSQWSNPLNWMAEPGNLEANDDEVPVPNSTAEFQVDGATIIVDERQPASGELFKFYPKEATTLDITASGSLYVGSQSYVDTGSVFTVDGGLLKTGKFQERGGKLVLRNGATFLRYKQDFELKGGDLEIYGSGNTFDHSSNQGNADEFKFSRGNASTVRWIADAGGLTTLLVNDYWGEDADRHVEIDLSAMSDPAGLYTLIDAEQGLNMASDGTPLIEEFSSVTVTGLPAGYTSSVIYDEANDDINLSVVPEPATMSLLALGGLGVLLRRRRKS